jgi:hypothetical protein
MTVGFVDTAEVGRLFAIHKHNTLSFPASDFLPLPFLTSSLLPDSHRLTKSPEGIGIE